MFVIGRIIARRRTARRIRGCVHSGFGVRCTQSERATARSRNMRKRIGKERKGKGKGKGKEEKEVEKSQRWNRTLKAPFVSCVLFFRLQPRSCAYATHGIVWLTSHDSLIRQPSSTAPVVVSVIIVVRHLVGLLKIDSVPDRLDFCTGGSA